MPEIPEAERCTDRWMGKRCLLRIGHAGACMFQPPPVRHRP